jgi:cephalosporin-C deacetylase-like acetyl esterase
MFRSSHNQNTTYLTLLVPIGFILISTLPCQANPLKDTAPLNWEGDIASKLVDAADAFLLKKIDQAVLKRNAKTELRNSITLPGEYREKLKHIIGVRDERMKGSEILTGRIIHKSPEYSIRNFRLQAFGGVSVEGLLIEPDNAEFTTIYIPDPESFANTTRAQTLAANGHRVFVPVLIDRKTKHRKISNREFLYRSAFELGRHLIGYEVQKVSAIIDALNNTDQGIGVAGDGEGGLIAFYAAAVDKRIERTWVIGHFGKRERVWDEPAYRNVFGLLNEFGDAEIARLIHPRVLVIDPSPSPKIIVPRGTGGKPGKVPSFSPDQVLSEIKRAGLKPGDMSTYMGKQAKKHEPVALPVKELGNVQDRAFNEIDRHNQQLLDQSAETRRRYFSKLDTSSIEKFQTSIEPYRKKFASEVIGQFDDEIAPANPRTRLISETEKVLTYEVVLDVFGGTEGLFAYGILVIPKGIKKGEKRPVVVCQHGLEGRPQSTIGEKDHHYYKAFTTELAKLGFVTFAPQNIYIFQDRFRALQFKANAIGKTLFSLMVPQHQQITDWLGSLEFVDKERIGFYGLSYGGKSAMRIPPLVSNYCLSICSADFNEWVWKNASTRSRYSYVWTGEYEIFEWDLGSTFNYAEMAALIAPRPFMVERGHFDGVAPDETVAYEFAKVRNLYSAKLGIGNKTKIEWFVGPHTINGKETFKFLRQHLNWPEK